MSFHILHSSGIVVAHSTDGTAVVAQHWWHSNAMAQHWWHSSGGTAVVAQHWWHSSVVAQQWWQISADFTDTNQSYCTPSPAEQGNFS